MCGIIGYVGFRPATDILVAGLEKLEYRGYDSAGVAMLTPDGVEKVRAVGNLAGLRAAIEEADLPPEGQADANGSHTGIAHTRWATHGRVTVENAHPHADESEAIQIVLNGIVENHTELRAELEAEGRVFTSQTDAEVVAHLIARYWNGDLTAAVRAAYADLRGHYSIVAMHAEAPGVLVGARKETPLIVGVGENENFIASAIPAFMARTRMVTSIENGEIVTITPESITVTLADGTPVERSPERVEWDEEEAEKGGYDTFMMKEIHEQPDAIAETILDRLTSEDSVDLSDIGFGDEVLRDLDRIVIVACGTSFHSGMVGRYALERWARIPVEIEVASEYRYRDPVIGENDLVIGITQSGETADTLAAMRLARDRGAKVLAITNVMGSQATRDSDAVLYTRAGPEVSVAATKTFVAQVAAMYLIALRLAELRDTLGFSEVKGLINELRAIPDKMKATIDTESERMLEIAERHHQQRFFLYLGRHIGLPDARIRPCPV